MGVVAGWYLAPVSHLTETTVWLVGIDSVTGSESRIRDAIADRLSSFPQTSILDSLVVGEPSPGKHLLAGHLDTVPAQGHTTPMVEEGRLYGLRATDMKGGLAVMVHLVEDLGTDRLVAVFYAGEEGPIAGNQLGPILDGMPLLEEVDAAVVLEPTDRQLQAGCQGVVNAQVWFRGEAAHSARPWLGINAVTKAGRFLTMMDALEPEPHMLEGLEFREVISVTAARGGVANNIIPDHFELNVNYRFAPDRTIDQAVGRLRQICSDADGFEVRDAAPAAYPHVNHTLFTTLAEVAGAPITHKQGWTDVAQLTGRGIPAVNFGPGESALAHRPGESLRLDDLEWAYSALTAVLGS